MSGDLRVMSEQRFREWHRLADLDVYWDYFRARIDRDEYHARTDAIFDTYRTYIRHRLKLWQRGYIPAPKFD